VATSTTSPASRASLVRFSSADEMRDVLGAALTEVDLDEKVGPLVRAADLRMRLVCADLGITLNVCASDDPDHHIEWSFESRGAPKPKLELKMDSAIANRWLQGKASVPIAIARGEIKTKGDARCALLYLPAARLLIEPYRRVLCERYPQLLVG
jgi:hypothetical protein